MLSQLFLEFLPPNYILIATSNSLERDSVRKTIKFSKKFIVIEDHIHIYLGFLNDIPVVHLHGDSGGTTDQSIGRLLYEFLLNDLIPKPKLMILFGVCWGNPKFVNLNDVILCTEIESANQIRLTPQGIQPRTNNYSSNLNQYSIFESLINENTTIKFGKLISYDSRTTSQELRDTILNSNPEVYGGEMEAWAFITRRLQVPWIILKGVSDFADHMTLRSNQPTALNNALDILNLIISTIDKIDLFNNINFSEKSEELKNFNLGNEIKINLDINDTKEKITQYLNDKIHPLIKFRLDNFTYTTRDQSCIDLFTSFLLEFIQNSIVHGKSPSVSILFHNNVIKIKDNIKFYDITTSENHGGGKFAWSLLEKKYLDTEKITYEYKDNKYCFNFNTIQNSLNIPNECYLKPHILNDVRKCDKVFIDLKSSKMFSLSKIFIPIVKGLLDENKTVYMKVDSEDHEILFENFKEEYTNNFFIFY